MPTTPLPKAKTLREIRRACSLGALESGELSEFWVNTDAARDPERSVRQAIKMKLDDCLDGGDLHALVYGHGGCGKSTELAKLVEGFFAVTFSIRSEMNLSAVRAEDILLVLTERILSAAKDADLKVDDTLLKPVHDYFAATTKTVTAGSHSSTAVTAEASVGTPGLLSGRVKLMAGIKSEIKLDSSPCR